MLNYLLVFKEVVLDLHAIKIDYDGENFSLFVLSPLSSFFFANFRHTLIYVYSRDTLTMDEFSTTL